MRSTFERVYVPKFCEICGGEEFEGVVFGQESTRYLLARNPDRRMICMTCQNPPPLKPLAMTALPSFYADLENYPIVAWTPDS